MWLCRFLAAFASEREVHAQVPGAAPVWVTVPDVGADPQVFRFDGYQIDWIVRP